MVGGGGSRSGIQIAIVAGEPSGDRLGAGLVEAIRARRPDSRFVGVGGPKMAAAGCELLFDMERIGVIGLDGLANKLPGIFRIRRALLRRFTGGGGGNGRPDLFIGVDVPDFNLALARKLKAAGIPCVHYVSPTVWAWRGYRIHKIRRSIDHMLTLFPFEADYYREHNVPVTCVGHPMADQIGEPDPSNRCAARRRLGLDSDSDTGPLIALLPGSRRSEIRRLGLVFVEAARRILADRPTARFVLPFAGAAAADEFRRITHRTDDDGADATAGLPLRTLDGNARLALEACDLAVLASGTAALEAALLRRAHVVVYKLPALSYWLMQRLRHVDYYSMPNHLLPAPMIPELMQRHATPRNIARQVDEMLGDAGRLADLERHFADLHRALKLNANARAADAVLELAGRATGPAGAGG